MTPGWRAHSSRSGPGVEQFRILTVCTGNVCRSPAAERLLSVRLGPTLLVASAGTHAMVGAPISAPMTPHLEASGARVTDFAARSLTERDVRTSGLILGMTRAHRGAAVQEWPGAVRRAFTLVEFARLLERVDPSELPPGNRVARLRAAIPLATAHRSGPANPPDSDDIPDPYGRGDAAYAASYALIEAAVRQIERVILAG